MTETRAVREALEALDGDHRLLHALVERLHGELDLAGMAAGLAELQAALRRHFQEEERPGGLYDALGVCAREYRDTLGDLVDDHFRLSAHLGDLVHRAREVDGVAADALRGDVGRLLRALSDHERREHEMAAAALARGE
jgi:hypothetical protein